MTTTKTTARRPKAPAFKPAAYPDIYEATMADAKRAGLFGDRPKIAAGGDGGGEAAAAPPAGPKDAA